jgi:hypothetical protein
MKRRARAWVIAAAVIAVLGGAVLLAAFALRPGEVRFDAYDAAGHSIAWAALPYPALGSGGQPLPLAGPRPAGWMWVSSGETLSLQYGALLSEVEYAEQLKATCPASADPEEVAASARYMFAVRYPGATEAIDLPCHPSGSFYAADLPGGGLAVIRLEPGKTPAKVQATLGGAELAVREITPREAVAIQMQGAPPAASGLPDTLEDRVIRNDVQAVLAETDEQRAAALDGARVVIGEMLAAYKARHGAYPDSLAGLVAVPEAICSRLPLNPYSVDEQLGLEADAASLPATVAYDPATPELVRVVQQGELGALPLGANPK